MKPNEILLCLVLKKLYNRLRGKRSQIDSRKIFANQIIKMCFTE